jgi:hypothetical protein
MYLTLRKVRTALGLAHKATLCAAIPDVLVRNAVRSRSYEDPLRGYPRRVSEKCRKDSLIRRPSVRQSQTC